LEGADRIFIFGQFLTKLCNLIYKNPAHAKQIKKIDQIKKRTPTNGER
jgi:hypothetical protein